MGKGILPDAKKHASKVSAPGDKILQAGPQRIRAGGIAEGIVAQNLPIGKLQGDKVRADPGTPAPVVEEDAGIAAPGDLVKPPGIGGDFQRKAPVAEAQDGPPEAGAQIAVDQRQLEFKVADQRRDVHLPVEQPQGVVGGNPAAAGGAAGTKAIAPGVLGNVILIVNEIIHGCLPGDWPECIPPGSGPPA